jgi:predicted Zn finger-like uncharacterized protein
MTDDSLLTKCPHCQTLFRIQQEHLAAAGGEVRCGVCYKVFDAENEGLSYSQGEGSPAEKTFAGYDNSATAQDQEQEGEADYDEEIIDTSPEPEPGPQQALAAASIDLATTDDAPSLDDINQFSVNRSSISDIVAPGEDHSKGPLLKWGVFSLLAIALLFSQWLYFNFEKNAQQPKWRSIYTTVCETLGCQLPQYKNISSIKTERLAIKTHPEYSNVLIVDMIISNSAEHSQPLPLLNMTFFSLNGEPLAQRLFQPREYLGQQLQLLPKMPTKTPIHLSFAILDPGSEAVNYSVNFSPAS